MILERVAVEGFRALAARFEFTPSKNLTVISAPNGTGKSTLLEAIYYGLLERHTVNGEKAKERFASRGRSLVPRIEIDFSVDQARYRIAKGFLGGRSSKLERWELDRYVPLKEGADADAFVRELFAAEPPGTGPVDASKHWGLAHVLWAPNGAHYSTLPSSAADTVRSMLGGVITATPSERAVEGHVTSKYSEYFTDGGSHATSVTSKNLPALEKSLNAAHTAVAEAASDLARYNDARESYEQSTWAAERLNSQRAELRTALAAAKTQTVQYDDIAAKRASASSAEQRFEAAAKQVRAAVDAVAEITRADAARSAQRSAVQTEIAALDGRLADSAANIHAAMVVLEDARARRNRLQAAAHDVTEAEAYVRDRAGIEDARLAVATLDKAAADLDALSTRRSTLCAPSGTELMELRETDSERRLLEAKISASALALEISPLAETTLEVLAGDRTGALVLVGGVPATLTGTDEIIVEIPGFGRIKARGADSAAKLRKKLPPLADAMDAAFVRFGVTELSELEKRTAAALELDRQILERRDALEALGGDDERTRLRSVVAAAATRTAAAEAEHPEWCVSPPDAHALRTAFERDMQHCTDEENQAAAALQSLQAPNTAIVAALETQRARDRELDAEQQRERGRLEQIQADGLSPEERAIELDRLALEWTAARAERTSRDAALNAFAEDPRKICDAIEAEELRVGAEYERLNGAAQGALALLQEFAQRGSYQKLSEAQEAADELERRLEMERREARAAQLLHDIFERTRKQHIDSVLRPVEMSATKYLERIAGPYLGSISVSADLTPVGMRDAAAGTTIPIASTYSTGEREQIFLATRLALADVITGQRGRQLFVIDDALTATDPTRLRRFTMLLDELTQQNLQVIVATSDPSRYYGCANATHINLHAELASSAPA